MRNTIPFITPDKFVEAVESGELQRYGGILKDTSTGKIVGHLKEVGNLTEQLSAIPFSPLDALSHVGTHYQLTGIQRTLNALHLISSGGALASIATLGICVTGFAIIGAKLNNLNLKLDCQLQEIQEVKRIVEQLNMKWEALTMGNLTTAIEQLSIAEKVKIPQRRATLLVNASQTFSTLKNYYFDFFSSHNLWLDGSLSVNSILELYSRFIACCIGQLHAEFLLGDISAFRATWQVINSKVRQISEFDQHSALRVRTDSLLSRDIITRTRENRYSLAEQIKLLGAVVLENKVRIQTMSLEIDCLEEYRIAPIQYLNKLKMLKPNIVMIPLKG